MGKTEIKKVKGRCNSLKIAGLAIKDLSSGRTVNCHKEKGARECYCSLTAIRHFLTLLGNAPEEEDSSVVCCWRVEGPLVGWSKSSVSASKNFSYAACFEPKDKVLVWKQFSRPLLEPGFSLCVSLPPSSSLPPVQVTAV